MHQILTAWHKGLGGFLLAALVAAGPIVPGGSAAEAATLKIEIENLRSTRGEVHLALWDRSESFTDGDRKLAGARIPADRGRALEFKDLAPGRYALAVYHDENGNGKFDRTWIGLPDEGLGFSNGAWIGLGPPSFDEAAVTLDRDSRTIVISLRY